MADPRGLPLEPAAPKLRVAVLMGGNSSERTISLATGEMIARALDRSKYRVRAVDTVDVLSISSDHAATGLPRGTTNACLSAPDAGKVPIAGDKSDETFDGRADLVFIALHGKGGEDGAIQGMLEFLGVPYTGSGILASALAMNKTATKRLFASAGVPVIEGITVTKPEWVGPQRDAICRQVLDELGSAVFVKPNSEGSTFGATLVLDGSLLAEAIDTAMRYDANTLIERYIRGTEITVGVLEQPDGSLMPLPIVEIVPRSEYYDFESKYADGGSEHIIPARISPDQAELAAQLATQCHTLLGCCGVSRTDMIACDGKLYVLEVNTIPGMTPTSLLPQAAAHAGIDFPELLDRLIDSAIRHRASH